MNMLWPMSSVALCLAIFAAVIALPCSVTAGVVIAGLGVALLAFVGLRAMRLLGQDEQLRVQRLTGITVHNGPGVVWLNPLGYRSAEVLKAEVLGTLDYVKVKDSISGLQRMDQGPRQLFLGPHEQVVSRGQATSLGATDCLIVEDQMTGKRKAVRGPCVWFPGPNDLQHKSASVSLSKTEYIVVDDRLTGEQTMVKGPTVWFPGPYDAARAKQTAISLQDGEYLRLKDSVSGERWIQRGKALVFLEPTWKSESSVKKAWILKANEYIRFLNISTGKVTVHRGEATIFPAADEELLDNGVQTAVEIDGEHAALVRDRSSGQLRLVTAKQLFVPGPDETIEEVRELIKLADHEAMIIKDGGGEFQYYYGSEAKRAAEQPRAFFLPPYAEIQKIWWSRGPRRERKDVYFDRFDCRPHFMKFEFNCRTLDNVELVLEGVVFWELVDLPAMFRVTGDTSGDIYYHLRSQFILHVARVSLKAFMVGIHDIPKQVLEEDTEFYSARGIKAHSLEVTRYQCANASTSEILEQIIQETTNRMNRLSQVESENEVSLFRTQGQVEEAKLSSTFQEIQREQGKLEAHAAALTEADRVTTFLSELQAQVPELEERIRMWQVLRKTEALSVLSSGGAHLYFTPSDVDLSIEARNGSAPERAPRVAAGP